MIRLRPNADAPLVTASVGRGQALMTPVVVQVPGMTLRGVGLAALALVIPGAAAAQDAAVPEGVGVADRARPQYQPVGGRLGSFFLYPVVRIAAEATDNLRATPLDTEADTAVTIGGRAALRSNFSRHAANLAIHAARTLHSVNGPENASRYGARADGRYDFGRASWIGGTLAFDHDVEPRTSYTSPAGAAEPSHLNRVSAGVEVQRAVGRMSLGLAGTVVSRRYRNVRLRAGGQLDQGFRDAVVFAGTATASFEARPGVRVLARATLDRTDYTLAAGDLRQPLGLDRDSTGLRVEAGLRFDLTGLLYGEVRAGYLRRTYADARLQDTAGLSYGADLLWNITGLTSVRLSADRRIDEAAAIAIAGNRTTEIGLSIDHELRRNLILSATARHATIAPLGPVASSRDVQLGAGARWLLNRQLAVRLGYRYLRRSTPSPDQRFVENRVTAATEFSF